MTATGVSVVISTKDRLQMLRSAVTSVRRCLRPQDELIVVDSASRDPAAVRAVVGEATGVLRLEMPGLSRARNAGWRAAGAPIIAFTDDDCEVSPDWTRTIERAFHAPEIGFVTGRVLGDREAAIGTAAMVEEAPKRWTEVADPAGFGSGANMAFRRRTLEEIGGFDDELGSGTRFRSAEDHDAFVRALAAGWSGAYDPHVLVTHRLWRSRLGALSREYAYGVGVGALAFKAAARDSAGSPYGHPLEQFWRDGLVVAYRRLRQGWESGTAAALVKAVGVVVGRRRASRYRIERGMLHRR